MFPSLISLIFTLSLLANSIGANAVTADYYLHEARDALDPRWVRRDRVRPASIFSVRIGLVQSNLDKAEEYLHSVSDPSSPDYGRHWTSEQVIEAFKPADETVRAVQEWLHDAGIDNVVHSQTKGWLAFHARAEQMESLLQTEFHEYLDLHTKRSMPSCDKYHLPRSMKRHIDFVSPGIKLIARHTVPERDVERRRWAGISPRSHTHYRQPLEDILPTALNSSCRFDGNHPNCLKHCPETMTPACIAALYRIPKNNIQYPNASNRMGIYESEGDRWDQLDLDLFFTHYTHGRIPNGTHPINFSIDGGRSNVTIADFPKHNGEINLDLDLAYPIVYPQKIGIWDENDLHYQLWKNDTILWGFNQFLDAVDGSYCTFKAYGEKGDLKGVDPTYPDPRAHGGYNHSLECGVFKPPKVLSVSYGGQEAHLPVAYQKRQCLGFLKLGLQGTSLIFASGDAGVGSFKGCLGPNKNVFNPTWPNTCPWLTSVGATQIDPGNSIFAKQPESSVMYLNPLDINYNYTSGGGFSNIYPVPNYQRASVEGYLKNYPPAYKSYARLSPTLANPARLNITELVGDTGGIYNRIGRGYPDVSANGAQEAVVRDGIKQQLSGTSASAPIFASIINRINEERMAVGKGSLGFLNPALYANPSMMRDITNGSNVGCYTPGFQTAPGWDPASGLGTPDYPKMLKYFMSLP